jgi:hypothetical protein
VFLSGQSMRGIAVLLTGLACGGDDPSTRPSALPMGGAAPTIVTDEKMFGQLPEWRLDSAPLIIGSAAGHSAYLLNRAGMPWTLTNGNIVVPNNQSEIRWYDSTGVHVRTVGRKGQGPGDFGQLMSVYPIEGDTILATDGGLRRVSVFDPAGRFVRSYAAPPASYPVGVNWLNDRTMVFHRNVRLRRSLAAGDTGVLLDSVFVIRAGLDSVPYDTLARVKGWWRYIPHPDSYQDLKFAGIPLLGTGTSGIVVAHGDEFTLRWFDVSGKPTHITRVSVPPRPISQSMIEAYEAERANNDLKIALGGEAPPPKTRAVHAQYLPAITRVVLNRIGQTWVRRWVPDGAWRAEWIVFDSSGAPLARVMVPAGFLFADAGEGYILGRHTDEDGVQSLRRYRLAR